MKNTKNKLVSFVNNYSTVRYNNCTIYTGNGQRIIR